MKNRSRQQFPIEIYAPIEDGMKEEDALNRVIEICLIVFIET